MPEHATRLMPPPALETSALKVGDEAPPLNLTAAGGGTFVLAEALRRGRASLSRAESTDSATSVTPRLRNLSRFLCSSPSCTRQNGQFTQLPWDYLHPNHAGYNAMGLQVGIAPFAPAHHRSRRDD